MRASKSVSMCYGVGMKRYMHTCVLVTPLFLAGCGDWVKTTSPFSKQQVTEDELNAEVAAAKKEADAKVAEIATTTAEKNAAITKAQQDNLRAFNDAVATVKRDSEAKIEALAREHEQTQVNLAEQLTVLNRASEAQIASLQVQMQNDIESANAARQRIAEKRAQFGVLLSATESISNGFGPIGGLLGAVVGLGGAAFGLRGKRDAATTREAAERIIDAIEIVKEKDADFANKFKQHADTLNTWMGENAKKLVDATQRG